VSKERPENLALAIHHGKDGAVRRLVDAYQDRLYSYALRLLRNHFDAQEVTQDAFLRAIRTLNLKYDEEKCRNLWLEPWLFRITRNLAYSRLRRRPVLEEQIPDHAGQAAPLVLPSCALERLEATETQDALLKALDCMGSQARELIMLRFMEELRYSEIAEIVGASEVSVRGKVFRALRALRKLLAGSSGAAENSHSCRRSAPRRMKGRGLRPALSKLST